MQVMKKKNTMVRYTLVPESEDGSVPARCSRCPKLSLTKSKLIAFAVIGAVALGIILVSISHTSAWKYAKNVTDCLIVDNKSTCKSGRSRGYFSDKADLRHDKSQYKKRFPQVLLIGARKGGTRALLRFLNIHQDMVVSKHEAHFFDRKGNYDNGYDWYLDQMPESYPGQITMEKTPSYFVDPVAPERVHSFNSSIKIMLILRNPIDRAVSDYIQLKMKLQNPDTAQPFEKFAIHQETGEINMSYAPIVRSIYSQHLSQWLVYFNLSQILILDGENMKVRPWEEMYKVEEFLGIDHEIKKSRFVFNATKGFYCVKLTKPYSPWKSVERCLSPSKGRVHPSLDPNVQSTLIEFYRPYNEELFRMIKRKFHWF